MWRHELGVGVEEPTADVGVVVVHGIGDQSSGETLAAYGGAVVAYAKGKAEQLPIAFSDSADDHTLSFVWGDANEAHRCEITEAWWARSFPTPPVSRVLGWSALLAPWVLHRQLVSSQMHRIGQGPLLNLTLLVLVGIFTNRWILGCLVLGASAFLGWSLLVNGLVSVAVSAALFLVLAAVVLLIFWYLLGGAMVLVGLAKVAVVGVLTLVVQALLLVLTVVALLPIPWFRRWARSSMSLLTLSIGDSYAFIEAEQSDEAIVSAVHAAISEQSNRCRRLVIVAHSQGCAVLERTFDKRGAPDNLVQVITLGSGLAKLTHMRRQVKSRTKFVVGAGLRMIALITTAVLVALAWQRDWRFTSQRSGFAASLAGTSGTSAEDSSIGLILFAFCCAFAIWAGWLFLSAQRSAQDSLSRHQDSGASNWLWTDLVATHDLVPDGLADLRPPNSSSDPVVNRHSFVLDHTTYHENPEVLDEIVRAIERAAGAAPRLSYDDHALGVLHSERQMRGVLRLVSLATFSILIAVVVDVSMRRVFSWESRWPIVLYGLLALPVAIRPWLRWDNEAGRLEWHGCTVPVVGKFTLLNPVAWYRLRPASLDSLLPHVSRSSGRTARVNQRILADEKRRKAEQRRDRLLFWRS